MSLPTEFPKEAVKTLLSVIGGTVPPTVDLVVAGYDLIGYGLYVALGNPLAADDAETAQLKSQLADPAVQTQLAEKLMSLGPVAWSLILKAIQLILERLSK